MSGPEGDSQLRLPESPDVSIDVGSTENKTSKKLVSVGT